MTVVGVDIGGSHITAAQVHQLEGKFALGDLVEADVNTRAEVDQLIDSWVNIIKQAVGESSNFQIGIAMPGPFDYENGISWIEAQGKMKSLLGLSVRDLMAASLGILSSQIHFSNDAEAFLAGEIMADEHFSDQRVIGLTLGTGLGSAFYLDGKSQDAKLWTAPFRDGIAEDYFGTAWFVNKAKSEFGLKIKGVKDLILDQNREASEILFKEFGFSLGEFLLPYISQYQFEKILLGGKVTQSAALFLPFTLAYFRGKGVNISINLAKLGGKAALLGACHMFYSSIQLDQ
jgi:glucokinase